MKAPNIAHLSLLTAVGILKSVHSQIKLYFIYIEFKVENISPISGKFDLK